MYLSERSHKTELRGDRGPNSPELSWSDASSEGSKEGGVGANAGFAVEYFGQFSYSITPKRYSRCHVAHDCAGRRSGAGAGGGGGVGEGEDEDEGEVESMPLGRGREGTSDSLFNLKVSRP